MLKPATFMGEFVFEKKNLKLQGRCTDFTQIVIGRTTHSVKTVVLCGSGSAL